MTPIDPNQKDPKDWTPEDALAVNAVPDEVRLHADPSETEIAQRGDGVLVDPEEEAYPDEDQGPNDEQGLAEQREPEDVKPDDVDPKDSVQ